MGCFSKCRSILVLSTVSTVQDYVMPLVHLDRTQEQHSELNSRSVRSWPVITGPHERQQQQNSPRSDGGLWSLTAVPEGWKQRTPSI